MSMGLSTSEKIVQKCGGDSIEYYDAGKMKGTTLRFSMAMKLASNELDVNSDDEEQENNQVIDSSISMN